MVPIYIAMVIVSPGRDPWVLRKLSNLPFPSPIGTTMMVPDCELAIVKGYHHENPWGDDGAFTDEAFYVFVSPTSKDLRSKTPKGDGRDFSKFFGYRDEERFCDAYELLVHRFGWEAMSNDVSEYLVSFFSRS